MDSWDGVIGRLLLGMTDLESLFVRVALLAFSSTRPLRGGINSGRGKPVCRPD